MRRFMETLHGKTSIVLAVMLLFSATAMWIHIITVRSYSRQQLTAAAKQENISYTTAINTSFNMLEESLFYLPRNNHYFQDLLQYDPAKAKDSLEFWSVTTKIRRNLDSLRSICPYVETVFVYLPEQGIFLNEQINPEMTSRICSMIDSGRNFEEGWIPTASSGRTYLLRVFPYNHYYIGTWISVDSIESYFIGNISSGNTSSGSGKICIFSNEGKALSSEPFSDAFDPAPAGQAADTGKDILISDYADHPGIYLVRLVSEPSLIGESGLSRISFFLICIMYILLLVFVLAGISIWVLQPVHMLSSGIRRIRSGETDYRLPPSPRYSSEFRDIQEEFNAMMDETKQIRIRMYEQQLQQDEVKLRYLSQQIQPHFILNSLNTLYAYIGRDSEISKEIIRLLSRYYRYIINIESQYVALGQEVEHLENYLSFQKIRYVDRLQYTIELDERVKEVPVPPLMLESFVGNILKYGQDEEDCITMRISAEMTEPDQVRILISDHGDGFPGEILDALQKYRHTGRRDDLLGIGICNSLDRLNLIYGENASINFYNKIPEGGAVVEILIRPISGLPGGQEGDVKDE